MVRDTPLAEAGSCLLILDSHPGPSLRRTPARALVRGAILGLLAVASLPATAGATHNDSYSSPEAINSPGTGLSQGLGKSIRLPSRPAIDFRRDPDRLRLRVRLRLGGNDLLLGADVWYTFYPHRDGRIQVSLRQFCHYEPVVRVSRFAGSVFDLPASKCRGATPLFNRVDLPVKAGESYRIQVGGRNTPNSLAGSLRQATTSSTFATTRTPTATAWRRAGSVDGPRPGNLRAVWTATTTDRRPDDRCVGQEARPPRGARQ